MAVSNDMYYPLLRKLDFPIVRYHGGVSNALRQHREAVAHLLGPDEPAEPYARTSLALLDSPGIPSIFDFGDPVLSVEDDDDDDAGIVQPAPAPAAAVQNGTDSETLRLVQALSCGQRRTTRGRKAGLRPRNRTPESSPSPSPSPPPQKKRKRTRCADEEEDDASNAGDRDSSPSPSPSPPPTKKQRRSRPAALNLTIPAPSAPAPPAPAPAPASPAPAPRQRTSNGANIGQALPATVQREVNFINNMRRMSNGYPSRNKLRKAPATATEISRKSGYLMTERRGGSLRRWFGDEAVFEMKMWRFLVGEHEG